MKHEALFWLAQLIPIALLPQLMSVDAAEIVVGDHQLQANAPDQLIEIPISGGEPVSGLDLFVQVGDGGPELELLGLPPGTRGPEISGVELINGTIFDGVNDLPTDIGTPTLTQAAVYTLALVGAVPTVAANGTLVRLTLDTTGLFHGQWELKLSDVLPHDQFGGPYSTNLAGVAADIQNGSLTIPVSIGDFNNDQMLDVRDIDALSQAIQSKQDPPAFDLTADGSVNATDLRFWVERIKPTYIGDADLDGEFGTGDLVDVFRAGEYEDNMVGNSTWATGDWNADAEFSTGDLVVAFQGGGFEQGPRAAVSAVPEPSGPAVLTIALVATLTVRRRRCIKNEGL